MSEQSSNTSQTALAFYDPDSSCWRMSQGCLLSEAPELLQRLPDWGTTSGGVLYELQMPELLTGVRDGSASPPRGMPTPRAADSYERRNRKTMIRIRDEGGDMTLTTWAKVVVPELLPTPVVNDMGAGKTIEEWDTWTDEMKAKHGNSNGHGPSLSIEIAKLLPTPRSFMAHMADRPLKIRDMYKNNLEEAIALLPTPQHWDHKVFGPNVDWKKRAESHAESVASVLMNLPSDDGSESSGDPPPHQQTTEDSDPDSSSG